MARHRGSGSADTHVMSLLAGHTEYLDEEEGIKLSELEDLVRVASRVHELSVDLSQLMGKRKQLALHAQNVPTNCLLRASSYSKGTCPSSALRTRQQLTAKWPRQWRMH